ncbi:M48 family metallopeptidase [Marinobacter sp. M-5]|uniref:M48 family metallopeptidase n=1 Tax=Marinobacter sp. M-5 TaxID=3081089 RepID=UPI00293CF7BF|nr:M48 family metallopeptidase [Marinobacter sp. M-5]MDV3503147.1 M48 family metallopeptidase [Marinobacter sp. M-5]
MAHPGFFQRQASARRNTSALVALFLVAVTLITLAVCVVGYFVTRSESSGLAFHHWLLSQHGLLTAAAVVLLIGGGSLVRWVDLAGGGERVAKMVGAREIDPDTRDADERKLRNIVEEMAIASGVTVPTLYVMDQETGINAFVAGYSPGQAVMVVTHGALTQLTRDELQGVVAHEFSHIFNGDMRLNVRLIAILAGILMLGQIGGFLLRAGSFRSSRSSRDGRGQAAIGLIGLALLIIGYIGVFFGRLIQAAVSRQRETLADASSVQFTRNPEGIAGALFKIGLKGGYLDTTSHASDMNHMCFGESARMKLSSLLASHPPIEKRIHAIQPGMLARLRSRLRDTEAAPGPSHTRQPSASAERPAQASGFAGTPASGFSRQVGSASAAGEYYAVDLLANLPATFRSLLYTRSGAVQLCYALLLYSLPRSEQDAALARIDAHPLLGPQRDLLDKFLPTLERQGERLRFPALELAMPALRKLDSDERAGLQAAVGDLIRADRKVSLFELAMSSFLNRHLAADSQRVVPVTHRNYKAVLPALRVLMSLLARAGAENRHGAEALYQQAMAGFASSEGESQLAPRVSLKELQEALHTLNRLSPLLKPAVIDACGHCVTHDGRVDTAEYELMRLVADQLDCPMPPLAA